MPVPTAVPPCASSASRGSDDFDALDAVRDLAGPTAHDLPHAHRHGVHQVGAARRHHVIDRRGLLYQRLVQVAQGRQQVLADRQVGAHVDRRRDHVVGALAHVDVVVLVHLAAQVLGGQARQHLVGVHVGAGARTRLENVQHKVVVMLAHCHLVRRFLDGLGHGGLHQAQFLVGGRGCTLDQPQRTHKRTREAQVADREVVDRTLRLCTVEGVHRHPDFAHAVALDAMCLFCHDLKLLWILERNKIEFIKIVAFCPYEPEISPPNLTPLSPLSTILTSN